ncbi:MAG TPA: flagellar biosynthesis protein FliQ [Aliidongia sp.]|nr:flagellar biosynthesis protein FliQ [Aliidongia sp.]
MNQSQILDISREAIFVILKIGGPAMILALIVGVSISIFQALTQIQEQTLTFMPKIIVIFLAMLVLLPFMLETLTNFTHGLVDRIISIQ